MNHSHDASENDEPTNHDPPTFRKAGIGKSHQIVSELVQRLADEPTFEFVDSKGDGGEN